MSHLHSDTLRKIMLRRFIEEYQTRTGQSLTQGKLAEMLGIQQAQISQYLSSERKITERRWQDIVRVFGQEDKAAAEDYSQFEQQLALQGEVHHGQLLREYLKNRNIAHKEAAERLQVSAAAVTNFLYSEQFRPELLQKLKEGLGFSLPATYNARNAVFLHSNQKTADFGGQYFDLGQIGAEWDLKKTIVVQIESDDLAPAIPVGAKVLAVLVKKEEYENVKGPSVLHIGEDLALVRSFEAIDIPEGDIKALYKIVLSLVSIQ